MSTIVVVHVTADTIVTSTDGGPRQASSWWQIRQAASEENGDENLRAIYAGVLLTARNMCAPRGLVRAQEVTYWRGGSRTGDLCVSYRSLNGLILPVEIRPEASPLCSESVRELDPDEVHEVVSIRRQGQRTREELAAYAASARNTL